MVGRPCTAGAAREDVGFADERALALVASVKGVSHQTRGRAQPYIRPHSRPGALPNWQGRGGSPFSKTQHGAHKEPRRSTELAVLNVPVARSDVSSSPLRVAFADLRLVMAGNQFANKPVQVAREIEPDFRQLLNDGAGA